MGKHVGQYQAGAHGSQWAWWGQQAGYSAQGALWAGCTEEVGNQEMQQQGRNSQCIFDALDGCLEAVGWAGALGSPSSEVRACRPGMGDAGRAPGIQIPPCSFACFRQRAGISPRLIHRSTLVVVPTG